MRTISSNSAKQSFGQVLESAQREPILIQKHNHPAAVLVSVAEYDRLRSDSATDTTRESPASYSSKRSGAAKTLPVVRLREKHRGAKLSAQAMVDLVKNAEWDTHA